MIQFKIYTMASAQELEDTKTRYAFCNSKIQPIINELFETLQIGKKKQHVRDIQILETIKTIASNFNLTLDDLHRLTKEMVSLYNDDEYRYIPVFQIVYPNEDKIIADGFIMGIEEGQLYIISSCSQEFTDITLEIIACLGIIFVKFTEVNYTGRNKMKIPRLPDNVKQIEIGNEYFFNSQYDNIEIVEFPEYMQGLILYGMHSKEFAHKLKKPLKYLATSSLQLDYLPPVEILKVSAKINPGNMHFLELEDYHFNEDGMPKILFANLQFGLKSFTYEGIFTDEFGTLPGTIEFIKIKFLYSIT